MDKAIIKDIRFPDFGEVNLYRTYGNNYYHITGQTITKPVQIVARCFFEKQLFPYTDEGYKEAQKWLLEQRKFVMKKLYIEVE